MKLKPVSDCCYLVLILTVFCIVGSVNYVFAGWTTTTLDSAGSVGEFTSIAIDSNNKAHISYRDYTNDDLKYATNESEEFSFASVPKPKLPPLLSISSVKFEDADKNNILEADETGKIIVSVLNNGKGDAYSVFAEIKANVGYKGIKTEKTKTINIKSKKSIEMEIPIFAERSILTGKANFTLSVKEANGFDADPMNIGFDTKQFYPPDLRINETGIEEISAVEKNNKIDVGEVIEVKAIIQNKGLGKAKNVIANIHIKDPNIFLLSDGKFVLGNVDPDDWKKIDFSFTVNKRYSGKGDLPIYISFEDERKEFAKEEKLNLTIGKTIKEIKEIVFKAKEDETAKLPVPELSIDIEKNIPSTSSKNPDAIGVIIGVKNYKNTDVPKVEYALNDALLVKEYLVKTLGYRDGNIIYLEDPTQGDLMRVFGSKDNYKGQLYNYINTDNKPDVFIYYSGHGSPDTETKSAYFVPVDCHPNFVKINGYPLGIFYDNLNKLDVKNITVVIDACFSGGSDKGMLVAKASPLVVSAIQNNISEKITVFTSSAGEEVSSWYPEKRHGLFTYFFLKALTGIADANKDKKLSFDEVTSYVNKNVSYLARRLYNRTQTPIFIGDKEKVLLKSE